MLKSSFLKNQPLLCILMNFFFDLFLQFCFDNTILSPISWHSWCKKMCPLIRGLHFLKSWAILVLFSKNYYLYTYVWGSQGKWKISGSPWINIRKKEMMLNCYNSKHFKTKYQQVRCNIQLYSSIKESSLLLTRKNIWNLIGWEE